MRTWFVLLIVGCLVAGALPAGAQDDRPVITPGNAALLTQVGMLGQGIFKELQWSPDGKTLTVASSVGIWLYEAEQAAPRLVDDFGAVLDLAYGPEGALLAAAQQEQILLLDTATWTLVRVLEGPAREVAFSPDGTLLAAAGFGQVQLWDVVAGEVVHTWKHENVLNCLSFDPTGRFVAGGSGHPKMTPHLYVWDVWTGDVVDEQAMSDIVSYVAFSPSRPLLAVGCFYGRNAVLLWDFQAHRLVKELDTGNGIDDLVFSQDGGSLFVAAQSGEMQVWGTATFRKTTLLPGSTSRSGYQALSPDKQTLASTSAGTVILWDVATGEERARFPGNVAQDSAILFSPDSTLLASANLNGPVDLWDVTTGTVRQSWRNWAVLSLTFSPDGTRLAGASHSSLTFTGPLFVWNLETAQGTSFLDDASYDIGSVVFNPDGTKLAVTANLKPGPRRILVLDSTTGDILEEWEPPCCYAFYWVKRFSDDGVEVWLRRNFEPGGYDLFYPHTGEIVSLPEGLDPPVMFSPDGDLLVAENEAGQLEVWDAHTWESLLRLPTSRPHYTAFNPASTLLAVGSWENGSLEIWDITTGERLFQYTQTDSIQKVVFSPDGTLLASAGKDGVIRLWGVPQPN